MKQIDRLKKQVTTILAIAKKAKKKEIVVMNFNRDSFKKKLTTERGFGSQDLKPVNLELYNWMQKKFGNKLKVTAGGGASNTSFDTQFTVTL
jgi:ABC-type sugar transport system substrate-binding protein